MEGQSCSPPKSQPPADKLQRAFPHPKSTGSSSQVIRRLDQNGTVTAYGPELQYLLTRARGVPILGGQSRHIHWLFSHDADSTQIGKKSHKCRGNGNQLRSKLSEVLVEDSPAIKDQAQKLHVPVSYACGISKSM